MEKKVKKYEHPDMGGTPMTMPRETDFKKKKNKDKNGVDMNQFIKDMSLMIETAVNAKKYDFEKDRVYPYLLIDLQKMDMNKFKDNPHLLISDMILNINHLKENFKKEIERVIEIKKEEKEYISTLSKKVKEKTEEAFKDVKIEHNPKYHGTPFEFAMRMDMYKRNTEKNFISALKRMENHSFRKLIDNFEITHDPKTMVMVLKVEDFPETRFSLR